MREYLKKFFKSKFNIVIAIVEAIAITLFIIGYFLSPICTYLFFLCQGAVCIMLGIKQLGTNKGITFNQQFYEELPYTESEKRALRKTDSSVIKNNKFLGISLIVIGSILILACLGIF